MRPTDRHSKRRVTRALALLAVVALSLAATTDAADIESRARDVEGKLMAPCCGANTVREHDSGPAMRMREEIRQMLVEGRSEQEILDFYAAKYGEKILAMPEARGFNLVPYLAPMLLLVLGGAGLLVAMRRWRGGRGAEAEQRPLPKLDPAYLERLERDVGREA